VLHAWVAGTLNETVNETVQSHNSTGNDGNPTIPIPIISDGNLDLLTTLYCLAAYFPIITFLWASVDFLVVRDSLQGLFCPLFLQSTTDKNLVNKKSYNMGIKDQGKLYAFVLGDLYLWAHSSLILFSTIPEWFACWSLAWNGHRFE
jgi:hypothetical protein